jgi:hypothetical protein
VRLTTVGDAWRALRGLLAGIALVSLTVGTVSGPLPAAGGGDGPGREGRPAITPGAWLESGLAVSRTESKPAPHGGTQAATALGRPPLPTLPAARAAATRADAAAGSLPALGHPSRGPPALPA